MRESSQSEADMESRIDKKVEEKLKELLSPDGLPVNAAFCRGGKRGPIAKRRPKPIDICHACKGHGHWA